MIRIHIFSEDVSRADHRDHLEELVNKCLEDNPGSSIQWLQSGCNTHCVAFAQLTAIITIPDGENIPEIKDLQRVEIE